MTTIVKGLFGGKSSSEKILERFNPAGSTENQTQVQAVSETSLQAAINFSGFWGDRTSALPSEADIKLNLPKRSANDPI